MVDRGMYNDTIWVRTDELCEKCKLRSEHLPILEKMRKERQELPCWCAVYEPKGEGE